MAQTNTSHYLSNQERSFIFSLYSQGFSFSLIKTEFYALYHKIIYNSTISDICKKVEATGSVETLAKSGRPRIYNERECRGIVRNSLKSQTRSKRDLTEEEKINPKEASDRTIRRILTTNKVVSRIIPKRMDALTKDHVKQRLKFGNDHLHWDVHDWGLIVFSDESDLLPVKYGRQYVRLKEGQKFVDVIPLRETAKKEVTIKVWGTISFLGVGTLIRYEDTMDAITYKDILQDHLFQEYPMLENSAMELEGPIGELPRFGFVQVDFSHC